MQPKKSTFHSVSNFEESTAFLVSSNHYNTEFNDCIWNTVWGSSSLQGIYSFISKNTFFKKALLSLSFCQDTVSAKVKQ